jgi:hypothetical protein
MQQHGGLLHTLEPAHASRACRACMCPHANPRLHPSTPHACRAGYACKPQIARYNFGEDFPGDGAPPFARLVAVLTALTGLLGFALILALVEQVSGGGRMGGCAHAQPPVRRVGRPRSCACHPPAGHGRRWAWHVLALGPGSRQPQTATQVNRHQAALAATRSPSSLCLSPALACHRV